MKEGWKYMKLGEVCDFLNGFAFKSSNYVDYGIRIIRITNVQKGIIVDTSPKYYPLSEKSNLNKYILKENDLLMSLTGNVGRVGLLPKELMPAALNQRVACIRMKNDNLSKTFLFHYFNSNSFEQLCIKNASGAAQLNMSTIWLSSVQIPVPPLSEQQRIVTYLDAEFAKIEALKANAEKQLQAAKDLFQAALKELLTPKEGWEEKKLGEVTSNIGDGLHGTPKYSDSGEYYFINGNNLENGSIEIKPETKRINKKEYDLYKVPLNENSVLLSINGTIGKTAFYDNEKIILGKSACYINVLSILKKEYLRYFIMSDYFNDYTHRNVRQATIKNLGLKEIRNMPIIIPPLPEQQRIADRLDALSANVKALQTNYTETITLCNDLKQALLKKVFEEDG